MSANTRLVSSLACIALLTLLVISAGCSSSQAPSPAAPAQPASTGGNTVTMKNFAFDPPALTVKSGTAVTWVNQDSATHTVVSDTGSPESFSSEPLSTGGTYTRTFTVPGTYSYHCSIHPSMKGTVTVQQ
jgi:plastocyanin